MKDESAEVQVGLIAPPVVFDPVGWGALNSKDPPPGLGCRC